jgi:UDP-glucuronate 4-epimerase
MARKYSNWPRVCNTNKLKTILITGCSGFIGFHLSKNILSNKLNCKIIGIDNLNHLTGLKIKKDRLKILKDYKNFYFYKINISNYNKIEEIFKNNKIHTVINLAALAGIRNSIKYPKNYFNSNVLGFFNIINLSEKYKIKKFIYASSSSVYGDVLSFPTSEKISTSNQESFYAMTKKTNEIIANFVSKDSKIKMVGVRFFTVYGEYGRPDMFLKNIVSAFIKNRRFDVYGHGNHERDFTYILDVLKYLNLIIFSKSKNNQLHSIYNIGSGNKIPLMKIINIVQDLLNKKGKLNFINKQKGDVLITHSDNTLIQNDYKKFKFTNIKKGIQNYIEWHQKYYN